MLGLMPLRRHIGIAAVALGLALLPGMEEGLANGPHPCQAAVEAELGGLGLAAVDVRRIVFVDVQYGGRNGFRVIGYEAWTDPLTCRGSVVMSMTLECRIRETYSRGACRFPAVPAFR